MDIVKDFKTIQQEASYEFTEKRSRFIGYVKPTKSEKESLEFINEIKSLHRQATHNVYAYSLRERNFCRFSDDGEPQGTAGMPVLDVLKKQEIVDATIVVTRYFGGTLLGTGGLVRAYSKSAKLALDTGKIVVMSFFINGSLECEYTSFGKISACICDLGGKIDESDFAGNVRLRFHIGQEKLDVLREEVLQITSGKTVVSFQEGSFYKK